MQRCPACSENLVQRRIDDRAVAGCRQCGGTWVPHASLNALVRSAPTALAKHDRAFVTGMTQALGQPTATHQCPDCSQHLTEHPYPGVPNVSVSNCAGCGGSFFAHGMLDRLAGEFQPANEPSMLESGVVSVASDEPDSEFEHFDTVLDIPHFSWSDGIIERAIAALNFVLQSYRVVFKWKALLLPVAIAFVFNALLGVSYLGLLVTNSGAEPVEGQRAYSALFLFSLAVVSLLLSVVHYCSTAMVVHMGLDLMRGKDASFGAALKCVTQKLPTLFGMACIDMLISMLARTLRRRRLGFSGEALAGIATWIIESIWTVATHLMLPVIVTESVGIRGALQRSRALHSDNVPGVAIGEFGVGTAQLLMNGLALGLGALLLRVTWDLGIEARLCAVAVGVSVFLVVLAVNTAARGVYYAALYANAIRSQRLETMSQQPSKAVFAA